MEEEVADRMDGKHNVYQSHVCDYSEFLLNRVFAFVASLF